MKTLLLRSLLKPCLVWAAMLAFSASAHAATADAAAAPEEPAIPTGQLLQPADLAALLQAPGGDKPLVLQVGSAALFAQGHIPASQYAGPAGKDAGLQALRDHVKGLGHDRFIVIYCGCCPWNKCPNIRRAFRELASLGFTNVKALYVAGDFGTDWVAKGYPVEKGP